jgi:phosphonate transport system substrate-binding protein
MVIVKALPVMAEEGIYEMGAFPNMPVAKLQELFTPLADEFSRTLGRKVRLSSKPTFEAFESVLNSEFYDIAHIQPFDYVEAFDKHNYLPLARRSEELEALFVVNQGSLINSIADMKGKKIVSPPPDAAVSHLANMALRDAGINPKSDVKREYSKNHFSCLQNVLIGEADVCVAAIQMIRQFEKEKKITVPFRVVHKSRKIPHTLFVVHKRVSQKDRDLLLNTVLNLQNSGNGRKILGALDYRPFVQARDSDYTLIRKFIREGK